MLYIGYPISIEEASRLFGFTGENRYETRDYINRTIHAYFPDLSLFPVGRYCVFLGYIVKDVENIWEKHTSVSSFIEKVQQISNNIKEQLEMLNIDMSSVSLALVEGGEKVVENPEPIVWSFPDSV